MGKQAKPLESLEARVLGALSDYADREPEDGETWESWFHAAFDLASAKISREFARATGD